MYKKNVLASGQNRKSKSPESLEESQARADAVFYSIGVGAIATDEDGNINRINDVALEILGYERSDVIHKWLPNVVKTVDEKGQKIPLMNRPITQALVTGKPVSAKLSFFTKHRKLVPVSITASPIMLKGRPIGVIEVFHDVSREDEIDRMKSEFISIASHQLRTPLSAINTYANLLSSGYEGPLNAGQQSQMQIILSAVERMNNLINTLLDISKLEAGTLDVRYKDTNITQLIDRTINELIPFAKSKNIKLKVDYPKEKIVISSDPLLLGEIYTNLISNAIKYTPEKGSIIVTVEKKGCEVIFMINDNGYGIPASMHDQVFTKFFRGSNIQKRDTTGTGLGLYMVKQIADAIGARLWFKSKEDQGSCFYLALPISSPDSD